MVNSTSKFNMASFDKTGNLGLSQWSVKDLLVQQGMLRALEETNPQGLEDRD